MLYLFVLLLFINTVCNQNVFRLVYDRAEVIESRERDEWAHVLDHYATTFESFTELNAAFKVGTILKTPPPITMVYLVKKTVSSITWPNNRFRLYFVDFAVLFVQKLLL